MGRKNNRLEEKVGYQSSYSTYDTEFVINSTSSSRRSGV